MRVGIICEGERTDGPTLEVLLRAEFPGMTFQFMPTTKGLIFAKVGGLSDELIRTGCDRVLVAWDLHPVGTQMTVSSQHSESKPCQREQRKKLLEVAISTSDVSRPDWIGLHRRYGFSEGDEPEHARLHLVCFCESFDAAFLADTTFLRTLASSDLRNAEPPPRVRTPTKERRPQEYLRRYFRQGHNPRLKYFNKHEHNVVLAKAFVEAGRLQNLRRHAGYLRLIEALANWNGQ